MSTRAATMPTPAAKAPKREAAQQASANADAPRPDLAVTEVAANTSTAIPRASPT